MEKFNLNNVMLSFPHLFDKQSFEGQEGKYQTQIVIEKGSANEKKLRKAYDAAVQEALGQGIKRTACQPWNREPGGSRGIVYDTAADPEDLEAGGKYEDERFHDALIVTAKNRNRPGVCDGRRNPLTKEDEAIYGGVIANVRLHFYTYTNNKGGIALQLDAVQKVRDDDRLGNYTPESFEDAFDEIDPNDDDYA